MGRRWGWVLILVCLGASLPQRALGERDHELVGYYTSWSIYARDYHVPDIPAQQVTAINYAFANIADGEIALGDPYADIDRFYPGDSWHPDSLRGSFHQLQILKRDHPHLRTLISVGGWTWSTHFSDVALTEASRSRFAASCVEFIQQYDFDGVDIDWEYPVSGGHPGNIYRPEDKENYTLLLAELREQLDATGEAYLLTIAAPASPEVIENLELSLIHPHLDWINLMTYDFHGPWGGELDPVTHMHAPLYADPEDPLPEPAHSSFNLDAAIQTYVAAGIPREKLHPGLAFYGRGYEGVSGGTGLYEPYSGPAGNGTWEAGVFDYWDLEANFIGQAGYGLHWQADALVPWLYNPAAGVMISFDNEQSISAKGEYILGEELGGAMFWEFSGDREGDLLSAIHATLHGVAAVPKNPRDPANPRHHDAPNCPARGPSLWIEGSHPVRGTAVLGYALPETGQTDVRVCDATGATIRRLDEGNRAAGVHRLTWDGLDGRGLAVPAGIYFVELRAGPDVVVRRLVFVP